MDTLAGLEAAVYLRKSRAEDGQDTETTLRRHTETLTAYAAAHGIHIIDTYKEVASGESLYTRPQMLRLLEDVEAGRYQAVLCMDMDRLSRGSMRDQGLILDAFKYSGTLIITPDKTYDLTKQSDEQYAELKTFVARFEYQSINKRLRQGLQKSIQEGCYVVNAPYGYRQVTVGRKPTLEIYEPEAKFVKMMFQLYAEGYGCVSVARKVNALGARPHRSEEFTRSSVKKIIDNPVYIGKVVWNQKSHIKKGRRGNEKHITIYNPKEKWTIVDGLHPAIIERDLWDKVQAISEKKYYPSKNDGTVKSPLVGLVKCENCGKNLQRLFMKKQHYLLCTRPGCCAAAKFEYVERRVLDFLRDTLDGLELREIPKTDNAAVELALAAIQKELAAAARQKARLYELLELGEYDIPTFRERMAVVQAKIRELDQQEADTRRQLDRTADTEQAAEKIKTVLDAYQAADAPGKNALLKSVVEVIYYSKEKKTKPTDFTLRVVLRDL